MQIHIHSWTWEHMYAHEKQTLYLLQSSEYQFSLVKNNIECDLKRTHRIFKVTVNVLLFKLKIYTWMVVVVNKN